MAPPLPRGLVGLRSSFQVARRRGEILIEKQTEEGEREDERWVHEEEEDGLTSKEVVGESCCVG